jgi:hypothetical protein
MGAALASFVRLSAVLAGDDGVPDDLAAGHIVPDARSGPSATLILSLWFIGAHPPTLSNGYYGHG